MAFVYEEVGLENKELWESIGWKDWGSKPIVFSKIIDWCVDKERGFFLQPIGGYIDMPTYYDLYYNGTIVRIEAISIPKVDEHQRVDLIWYIDNIYIPLSLWELQQDVINIAKEAFVANNRNIPLSRIKHVKVVLRCEPTCVEVDYNGR